MHENALQKSKGQNKFQIDNKKVFENILNIYIAMPVDTH
jgi:hypothetical protein